jgi:hypothetical protein
MGAQPAASTPGANEGLGTGLCSNFPATHKEIGFMALGGTLDVIDLGDKGFKLHTMIPFEAPAELLQ